MLLAAILVQSVMITGMSLKAFWHIREPGAVAAPWKYRALAQVTAASKLLQQVPEERSAARGSAVGATGRWLACTLGL